MKITDLDTDTAGEELEATTTGLVVRLALTPRVTDKASLAQAVLDRQTIREAVDRVEAFFKPLKALAYKLHGQLCDRERDVLDPLRALDQKKALAIREFHDAEQVERRRLEREAAEAARRDREAAAAAEAAALEAIGDVELAEAVIAEAIAAPAPVMVLPDPTAGVVSFTRRWHFRITDPARVPRDFLMVDDKKLGAYARAMKASAKVDGVEFYATDEPLNRR